MNVRLFSLWQSTLVIAFTPSSPLPSLFLPCTSGQSPWSVGRGPQGEILWVFGGSWWRWWWRVGSEAAPPSPHRMSLHSALSHRSSQLEQELRENISQLKSTIEMWEKGYPCGLVWSSVLLYDRYRRELVEWEEVIEKEKVEAQQFIKYVCVWVALNLGSFRKSLSMGALSVAVVWSCLRYLPSWLQGYGRGEGCGLPQPETRECRRFEDIPHTRADTTGTAGFRGRLHLHCRVDQTVGEYCNDDILLSLHHIVLLIPPSLLPTHTHTDLYIGQRDEQNTKLLSEGGWADQCWMSW